MWKILPAFLDTWWFYICWVYTFNFNKNSKFVHIDFTLTLVRGESFWVKFEGVHIGGLWGDCISKFSTHVYHRAMSCVPFLLQQALQQRVEFFCVDWGTKWSQPMIFWGQLFIIFFSFSLPKMLFEQKVETRTWIPQKKNSDYFNQWTKGSLYDIRPLQRTKGIRNSFGD